MSANNERLGEGLRIYAGAMQAWLARTLGSGRDQNWFARRVLDCLYSDKRARLESAVANERVRQGADFRPESTIPVYYMHIIARANWGEGCGASFGGDKKAITWMQEVGNARQDVAYYRPVSEEQAQHTLSTMLLLLDKADPDAAQQIRELRDGTAPAAPAVEPEPEPAPEPPAPLAPVVAHNLTPWRQVMPPHRDVAKGVYEQAEFAADLQQVASNDRNVDPAYGDPKEFFRRTHITASMQALLTNVVQRLRGLGGDPVVDLRTAFGGGKTHTLLAVLHMARHPRLRPHEKLQEIYDDAGGPPPPQTKVAVLVGTQLDPHPDSEVRSAEETGGAPIFSLWGDLAWQLAGREGFDLVAPFDNPETGGAPAGAVLDKLFAMAGPSVVLIDEVVAYLRNVDALGGGAYGAHLTFFQALTEAAKRNPKVAVLVSIPESDIEFGDARGAEIANQISNIFQRIGAPWQPLDHHEAFEVVRRRLFGDSLNAEERERTCRAFAAMYGESTDFPSETRESSYLTRLEQCYPIHPEIFDRLYLDWAGNVDRFQRTRGVLKLMADCIYRLWVANDPWPLIMPGSLPLADRAVKQQMIGYLNEMWNSPLDGDIDGAGSEAAKIDGETTRYGQIQAGRRLTRTVFLGSAPTSQQQGIEYSRILLGAIQPGESSALYGDALRALSGRLSFLYWLESRYWFDTKPNLNRVAADRLAGVDHDDAWDELEERLRNSAAFRERGAFSRVHTAPQSGADVADEPAARLAILPPRRGHLRGAEQSEALTLAQEILDSRGAAPRTHRNMLAFLAADEETAASALDHARHYIVWRGIAAEGERKVLQLDPVQQEQAEKSRDDHSGSVDQQLQEAYRWLFAPRIPAENPTGEIEWNAQLLPADAGAAPAARAAKQMEGDGALITQWAPLHLKKLLDDLLWQENDHVSLRKVWEDLAKYLYMHRLRDEQVLLETVRQGARSRDFFGYAQGVEDDGKYLGLVFGDLPPSVVADGSSVLVRPEVAARQLPTAEPEKPEVVEPPDPTVGPVEPALPKRFFGTIELNQDRMARHADQVIAEVVERIAAVDGARVKVSIEIEVEVDASEGFDDATQRTISENAAALGFGQASFEER